jgi:purine-nucleoside phosphorylase
MAIADEIEPLTHEQVVAVANRIKPTFIQLVKQIVSDVSYKKVVFLI